MILVGNSRGAGAELAQHLQKDENDHVEVHELRGFVSDTLEGAFNEVYAVSRGTKCRQYLYSLSLNPPETEHVTTDTFLAAIEKCETELGLANQARAIVFHEKNGRRHAHAVWSRIAIPEMKAVQMSFDRKKLQTLSRELYLEHKWQMPAGLARDSERDPLNFTLAEWQQARRTGRDARQIKAAIQDAWAISDSRGSFGHALAERGFKLAKGDRRGFVAVDHLGEVFSVARQVGITTKEIRQRLGDERDLLSADKASRLYADEMRSTLNSHRRELRHSTRIEIAELREELQALKATQRAERSELSAAIQCRALREALERQDRFRKGLSGLWDRLRGAHKRIHSENETDAERCRSRDKSELDQLTELHLTQRRALKVQAERLITQHKELQRDLSIDEKRYTRVLDRTKEPPNGQHRKRDGPSYEPTNF